MESQVSSRTVYDLATNSVVMRATEPYAANSQLFENYGWSNHAYMLAHGFVLNEHPKDQLHLEPLLLPFYDESRSFLLMTILGEDWNDNKYSVVLGRDVDDHVLAVFHIVHMSDESVQSIMRMLIDRATSQTPKKEVARKLLLNLEPPVLANTWQTLIKLVEDGVASLPAGSVESDEALLASSTTLRKNQRLAIEFRLSQRRLAHDLLQTYQTRADELRAKAWGTPPTSPKATSKKKKKREVGGAVNGEREGGTEANGTAKEQPKSGY